MSCIIPTIIELLLLGGIGYAISLSPYWYYIVGAIVLVLLLVLITRPSRKSAAEIVGKKTMRAGMYDWSAPGGFSFKENHPVPKFAADEVVLKVITAAINPIDYKAYIPKMPFVRHFKSHVVGRAVAGVVVAAGSKVTLHKVGDRVYGNSDTGSLAEFSTSSEKILAKCPKSLNWQEVTGLPVAGLTGYQVYKKNGLKFGDRVLVIGASGGTGILGVQMAKAMGAYVIGVCSTKNVDLVKSVGADEVLDYTVPDFHKKIEPGTLDFVYDTVTSWEDPWQEVWARPLLKKDATAPYSQINGRKCDVIRMYAGKAIGINLQRKGIDFHPVEPDGEDFRELSDLVDKGSIKVPIDTELPLDSSENLVKGFDRQKSRRAVGKIVFNVTPDYAPL